MLEMPATLVEVVANALCAEPEEKCGTRHDDQARVIIAAMKNAGWSVYPPRAPHFTVEKPAWYRRWRVIYRVGGKRDTVLDRSWSRWTAIKRAERLDKIKRGKHD